jgi:hypothetical protein
MGTRADFYIGRGKDAKWVGSVSWDGYPDGLPTDVLTAKTRTDFLRAIKGMSLVREDFTPPEFGWPWPWEDSNDTEYAYAFDQGKVAVSHYGGPWFDPLRFHNPEDADKPFDKKEALLRMDKWMENTDYKNKPRRLVFPNMKDVQRVTFGKRSGLFMMGNPPEEVISPPGVPEIRGKADTKPGEVPGAGPVRVRGYARRKPKKD